MGDCIVTFAEDELGHGRRAVGSEIESYLRNQGITSHAVRPPERVEDAGLVHLLDPAETELARQLLVEHPNVAGVDRAERASLLYFWVQSA